MGHGKRPQHAGTFHVTARSSAEERIFRDDRDYVALIHELGGSCGTICPGGGTNLANVVRSTRNHVRE